jgi:hypothetical protein
VVFIIYFFTMVEMPCWLGYCFYVYLLLAVLIGGLVAGVLLFIQAKNLAFGRYQCYACLDSLVCPHCSTGYQTFYKNWYKVGDQTFYSGAVTVKCSYCSGTRQCHHNSESSKNRRQMRAFGGYAIFVCYPAVFITFLTLVILFYAPWYIGCAGTEGLWNPEDEYYYWI